MDMNGRVGQGIKTLHQTHLTVRELILEKCINAVLIFDAIMVLSFVEPIPKRLPYSMVSLWLKNKSL